MSYFENTRKPVGFGGKTMVAMMNSGHGAMADWGFEHITIPADATVLDAGCGGGANIKKLLEKCSKGQVKGIDYSEISVEKSRKVKAKAIGLGGCEVLQASVAELPFEDNSFDLVLSLNGFHAFPDKEAAFRETFRVLKPGGTFCGCFYIAGQNKRTDWFIDHLYTPKGFFTPSFDTVTTLYQRLSKLYESVELETVESMTCFTCIKEMREMKKHQGLNTGYWLYWVASSLSMGASNILQYVLSLYVLEITGSATLFASMLSIIIFPRILLTPLAGVMADRVRKIRLMSLILLGEAVILGSYYILGQIVTINIFLIYLLVILLEAGEIFYGGCSAAILPE